MPWTPQKLFVRIKNCLSECCQNENTLPRAARTTTLLRHIKLRNIFTPKFACYILQLDLSGLKIYHMGREHASREKKLSMVNFFIFVQKNVSTIRFQEIKIRPLGGFEKMRFLCFYIIKSMARKGYFGPKYP